MAEERWRLFVALELPAEVRERLGELQRELRRQGLGHLRWVRPEGIHLTLKFLGETPVSRLAAIADALKEAVKGVPPLELGLGPAGAFGDRRGPRVLWVGLEGDLASLQELQRRVELAMVGLGFPREERPFAPHLTLARVPPEAVARSRGQIERALVALPVPRCLLVLREVSLMRSQLQPGGAVYTRLEAFPLV